MPAKKKSDKKKTKTDVEATATDTNETGTEPDATDGTGGDHPDDFDEEVEEEEIDEKYICPPGNCDEPGRCRKYIDKNYNKLKYITAAILFGSLVVGLIIHAILCSLKKQEDAREAEEMLKRKVQYAYFGEDFVMEDIF